MKAFRIMIELGPLTLYAGNYLRFEVSARPLAVTVGPITVMWSWWLAAWGVSVRRR